MCWTRPPRPAAAHEAELSGLDDAELIAPADCHVSYQGEPLAPRRVLRLGVR
jgi:hypothetical protein